MASLETLPAPLPLYIAKNLADLKSLDSLRRSSPLFNIIFHQHAVELFEHLMRKTLLNEVIIEIRAYVLLLLQNSNQLQTEGDFHSLYAQANKPLERTTPVMAISYTLREFSFLASTCNMILRTKLDHLYALPHEHPGVTRSELILESAGTPYSISEPSSPDWVEQQRMLRSTWRVRVSGKLCGVARQFAQGKPPDLPQPTLYGYWQKVWLADQMEEAATCFEELQTAGSITSDHSAPLSWEALVDAPLPASKASSTDVTHGTIYTHANTLEHSIRDAQEMSNGYRFFRLPIHQRGFGSPLEGTDWIVLRRLGLDIWSDRRLVEELELENYPSTIDPQSYGSPYRRGGDKRMCRRALWFTWGKLYAAALASRAESIE